MSDQCQMCGLKKDGKTTYKIRSGILKDKIVDLCSEDCKLLLEFQERKILKEIPVNMKFHRFKKDKETEEQLNEKSKTNKEETNDKPKKNPSKKKRVLAKKVASEE